MENCIQYFLKREKEIEKNINDLKREKKLEMTNQSLRDRFQIESKNAAFASRIIKEALISKVIKEDDPESNSRKYKKYIPFWA